MGLKPHLRRSRRDPPKEVGDEVTAQELEAAVEWKVGRMMQRPVFAVVEIDAGEVKISVTFPKTGQGPYEFEAATPKEAFEKCRKYFEDVPFGY